MIIGVHNFFMEGYKINEGIPNDPLPHRPRRRLPEMLRLLSLPPEDGYWGSFEATRTSRQSILDQEATAKKEEKAYETIDSHTGLTSQELIHAQHRHHPQRRNRPSRTQGAKEGIGGFEEGFSLLPF
jgi:hypothetical protein